ncbi:hypothetical protein OG858_46955 (plasmid) [Streptomyces europaeiscabiei]|uniref:hypothetical protein n=1 Tax=Streptomyces europaeiscabiei TaxID=146819 RepID=UPI002E82152C|nr:hypothetical protein [Streptomyces europaeiscabiei]WUD38849.1 hypothetical protein OG858_46955 [Streptomyces europaeiscabiei]
MTTASAIRLRPLDVIRAATTAITARGYYQPLSRQWEKEVPTALDVEVLLFGREPFERGDRVRFTRAATETTPQTLAAILAWAQAGAEGDDYRRRLARVARAEYVSTTDISLLASAVAAWRSSQKRAARAAQATTDAALSRHQGTVGERITRTVTVAAVIKQPEKTFGYSTQKRYLIKLRDAQGNVYVWPASPRDPGTLPRQGATVEVTATVKRHTTYANPSHGDTPQTYVTRCRWKPTAAPTA